MEKELNYSDVHDASIKEFYAHFPSVNKHRRWQSEEQKKLYDYYTIAFVHGAEWLFEQIKQQNL